MVIGLIQKLCSFLQPCSLNNQNFKYIFIILQVSMEFTTFNWNACDCTVKWRYISSWMNVFELKQNIAFLRMLFSTNLLVIVFLSYQWIEFERCNVCMNVFWDMVFKIKSCIRIFTKIKKLYRISLITVATLFWIYCKEKYFFSIFLQP